MAFSSQTFSVGQVLTAAQMNTVDGNIDAVRNYHKGTSAPANLTAGVSWIDDTSSPWTLKMYDGTDWLDWLSIDPTNDAIFHLGSSADILVSGTVSSAASLDITDLSSTYRAYLIVYSDLLPATDNVQFVVKTSTDNGSSFNGGGTDYRWAIELASQATTGGEQGSSGDSAVRLLSACGYTSSSEEAAGQLLVIDPAQAGSKTAFAHHGVHLNQSPAFISASGGGVRDKAEVNNAIQFLFNSGNISTMKYTVYGLRAS